MYLVAGSQSNLASTNSVVLMKLNKLVALRQSGEDKASDSDSKLHSISTEFHLKMSVHKVFLNISYF